jgi:hypothetical protein
MRLKWTGLIIVFGLLLLSCETSSNLIKGFFETNSETGPRFVNVRAKKQQQIKQELEMNWSGYTIYYIPEHAVLFDPKDDDNTLVVSSTRWIKFEDDKKAWVEILRQNTLTTETFSDRLLRSTTGFLEIIGPDEQFFGYLVHEKMDMVTLKIIDRNTMRIYYYQQREGGL